MQVLANVPLTELQLRYPGMAERVLYPLLASLHTMPRKKVTLDGNEAAAYVAHKTNEVIAIYPITPSSNMGEWSDQWSSEGKPNIWGNIPTVIEMQSEGGAAGAVHGALQAGRFDDDFHVGAGLAADDPEHVQDRRRVDVDGFPRGRAIAGRPCLVDLWRPSGRDGLPGDRLGNAGLELRAGSDGYGPDRAGGDAGSARADHALLRRFPHFTRSRARSSN